MSISQEDGFKVAHSRNASGAILPIASILLLVLMWFLFFVLRSSIAFNDKSQLQLHVLTALTNGINNAPNSTNLFLGACNAFAAVRGLNLPCQPADWPHNNVPIWNQSTTATRNYTNVTNGRESCDVNFVFTPVDVNNSNRATFCLTSSCTQLQNILPLTAVNTVASQGCIGGKAIAGFVSVDYSGDVVLPTLPLLALDGRFDNFQQKMTNPITRLSTPITSSAAPPLVEAHATFTPQRFDPYPSVFKELSTELQLPGLVQVLNNTSGAFRLPFATEEVDCRRNIALPSNNGYGDSPYQALGFSNSIATVSAGQMTRLLLSVGPTEPTDSMGVCEPDNMPDPIRPGTDFMGFASSPGVQCVANESLCQFGIPGTPITEALLYRFINTTRIFPRTSGGGGPIGGFQYESNAALISSTPNIYLPGYNNQTTLAAYHACYRKCSQYQWLSPYFRQHALSQSCFNSFLQTYRSAAQSAAFMFDGFGARVGINAFTNVLYPILPMMPTSMVAPIVPGVTSLDFPVGGPTASQAGADLVQRQFGSSSTLPVNISNRFNRDFGLNLTRLRSYCAREMSHQYTGGISAPMFFQTLSHPYRNSYATLPLACQAPVQPIPRGRTDNESIGDDGYFYFGNQTRACKTRASTPSERLHDPAVFAPLPSTGTPPVVFNSNLTAIHTDLDGNPATIGDNTYLNKFELYRACYSTAQSAEQVVANNFGMAADAPNPSFQRMTPINPGWSYRWCTDRLPNPIVALSALAPGPFQQAIDNDPSVLHDKGSGYLASIPGVPGGNAANSERFEDLFFAMPVGMPGNNKKPYPQSGRSVPNTFTSFGLWNAVRALRPDIANPVVTGTPQDVNRVVTLITNGGTNISIRQSLGQVPNDFNDSPTLGYGNTIFTMDPPPIAELPYYRSSGYGNGNIAALLPNVGDEYRGSLRETLHIIHSHVRRYDMKFLVLFVVDGIFTDKVQREFRQFHYGLRQPHTIIQNTVPAGAGFNYSFNFCKPPTFTTPLLPVTAPPPQCDSAYGQTGIGEAGCSGSVPLNPPACSPLPNVRVVLAIRQPGEAFTDFQTRIYSILNSNLRDLSVSWSVTQ